MGQCWDLEECCEGNSCSCDLAYADSVQFIEFIATALLCYISGLIDTTITNFGTNQGAAFVGVLNVFLLTLFIMAAGPGSGGHVNQTITFATMVTGLTGFSRGTVTLQASG